MNSGSDRVIVLTGSGEPVAGLLPSHQDAGPLSLLKAIRRGENVFRSG
jgi:antitoxin (DNA-binding transcriptional repressor) of toxin-antitoxin stability system